MKLLWAKPPIPGGSKALISSATQVTMLALNIPSQQGAGRQSGKVHKVLQDRTAAQCEDALHEDAKYKRSNPAETTQEVLVRHNLSLKVVPIGFRWVGIKN